jgi:hypothetical protein
MSIQQRKQNEAKIEILQKKRANYLIMRVNGFHLDCNEKKSLVSIKHICAIKF